MVPNADQWLANDNRTRHTCDRPFAHSPRHVKIKPPQHFIARVVPILFACAVAIQAGCATRAPVAASSEHRALFDSLAVVAGSRPPEVRFEGFPQNKGEGAAAGAASALVACMAWVADGSCSGSICGALAILSLGLCGVTTAVGGVVGATAAPSGDDVRAGEAATTNAVSALAISESLRDQVVSSAEAGGTRLVTVAPDLALKTAQLSDYRPLAVSGTDAALEITLTHVGLRGSRVNDSLQLYMQSRVRLVHSRDNSEAFSKDYEYVGENLDLSTWSSNQGKRLQQALIKGYESLGRHIYESVFLLYPFPDKSPQGIGLLSMGFGLAPIHPVTRGQLTDDDIITDRIAWTTVKELRPNLQWQAFPRPSDVQTSPEDMKRVRNIRYDLVIARERNLAPAELVYERRGLIGTTHRIDKPLLRATRYFWTVRARFELYGQQRLTEWSSVHFQARENLTAPSQFSYRFKTRK